jgi:DNA-binding GntR family transcriptional regulator
MVQRKPEVQAGKTEASAESRMYIAIYDAVMEHRLPPKTKLTEQALCQIYGLARHNVRKVLALLAADGLVDLEHNRGAFIASPTPEEALEMFELRQNLERLAIQKLMSQTSGSGIKSLKQMVQRERSAWQKGDRPTWIRLSADFHVALAKLAGNTLLADSLRRLVSRSTLLIATNQAPGQSACSFEEHQDILSHIEAGDKTGALKSMARHLHSCAQRLIVSEEKSFDLRSALNFN